MNDETRLGLICKALAFAASKHRDQRRKDVDAPPYINHPIAIAKIFVDTGRANDQCNRSRGHR